MTEGKQLLEVELAEGAELSVRRFVVRESFSTPFEVDLVIRKPQPLLDLRAVVGQPAKFTLSAMAAAPQTRIWSGVVAHMALSQSESEGLSTYSLRIVSRLWLLSQRVGNRIYQRKTLPEIAQALLEEWGITPKLELSGDYLKQDYVVQYGETDLQFVNRILERAGITYFFDPASTMVWSDAPQERGPRGGNLYFRDNPVESAAIDFVTKVRLMHTVQPGLSSLRDFDFRRKPDYPLFGDAPPTKPGETYEQYRYEPGVMVALDVPDGAGGGTPVADDKGPVRHSPKEGEKIATRRLEAERRGRRRVRLVSNCPDLPPGTVITIDDHPRADLGKPLLVTSLELAGTANERWTFVAEAVFTDLAHRPALRTPRPRIQGVQSALVVGPASNEIYTDEFGRVRVQFHWDREGKHSDESSCWIRVSQEWAGALFGSILIPRVGQEVLVAFLEGDPDRPIIVGRVYNETSAVPYKLPRHMTRSGLKSDSSPGGEGFNEILMEDRADYEVFYRQAEKDLQKLVKREEIERIGRNKTVIVGKNRSAVLRTLDATMVGQMSTWQIIAPTNKEELKILDQLEPAPSPTTTCIQMTDGRVVFTTGQATVAFDKGTIAFEAAGDIIINAAGGDVTLEGSRTFINTMSPPPAPKPKAIPKTEMGTFSSIVDRDPPPD